MPVIDAPDCAWVADVEVPFPQAMTDCHGASFPGSVKLPATLTASPDKIETGDVALSVTEGATLAIVTVRVSVFCHPNASLTVSVTVKLPSLEKVWLGVCPVAVVPSPNCHA